MSDVPGRGLGLWVPVSLLKETGLDLIDGIHHLIQIRQHTPLISLVSDNNPWFVENAMKYALSSGRMIEVLINIRREEDRLCVSVCDTGRGIKEEILECLKKGEIYVDGISSHTCVPAPKLLIIFNLAALP